MKTQHHYKMVLLLTLALYLDHHKTMKLYGSQLSLYDYTCFNYHRSPGGRAT